MSITFSPRRFLQGSRSGRYQGPTETIPARQHWASIWRAAAIGCGLATTVHVAAGVTDVVPKLVSVTATAAGAPVLVVEQLPGQRHEMYAERTTELALALGCGHVRVVERGGRLLALHLLPADPLLDPFDLAEVEQEGFLGIDEDGADVVLPWAERGHSVIQGASGSGKSVFTYGLLAGLAHRRDVQVAGIDPTGLLFRAWSDLPGADWRVSGLGDDLAQARAVLGELVREMDRRMALLPDNADSLAADETTPLLVVVLEELPGLLRAADLADKKIGAEVRGQIARLAAEGRKVATRLVLLAQRADAGILDGAVRGQMLTRVSFRVDNADAIAMLHPRRLVDVDAHTVAPPGVAWFTHPARGTLRLRAGSLDYAGYVARVRAAAVARAA